MAKQAKTLTEKELRRVLDHIATRSHAVRNRAMLLTLYYAGMRVGECAALRYEDVLDVEGKRHEELILFKKYTPNEFPAYDNYDAIEVSNTKDIPADYFGAMGVPITFLDKYNPDQFEILGITDRDNNSGLKTKEYGPEDAKNHTDLNRRGAIRIGNEYKSTYARLLIRRKQS